MNVTLHYEDGRTVTVKVAPSKRRYEVIEYGGVYFQWSSFVKGTRREEGYWEAFGVKASKDESP